MVNTDHYTYRITWSPEDGEFVGLCTEFPLLSWLEPEQDKAFLGIHNLIKECVEDMLSNGEIPPEPLSDRTYSGKFVVRILPKMHKALVMQASEEGVSLNRLVSSKLI